MNSTYFQFDHEQYEELCALATAEALTPEESAKLSAHLAECPSCSILMEQYETVATQGMTALAATFANPVCHETSDDSFALARLMRAAGAGEVQPSARIVPATSTWRWQSGRGLIAASLLLGAIFASYRFGEHRSAISQRMAPIGSSATPGIGSSGSQQSEALASQERALAATVAADKQQLADLEQSLADSRSEQERLRTEAQEAAEQAANRGNVLSASLAAANERYEAQLAALTQERDATAARLAQSQAGYQAVQEELNTLRSQHGQDTLRLASMEQRVNGLNAALIDGEKRVSSDEQYLSSDRDIRDLIGARNLYIADIMDVDESGKSKKPFGRVFYTKTKSLVFYAYDLDLQQGVKQASTFQVWGRTSATDRKPVNLGILYMDSETNRRWTLRVNNPQQLAQLDAIFVTVEPHVQNEKPTGKPFLFASLRRDANHP